MRQGLYEKILIKRNRETQLDINYVLIWWEFYQIFQQGAHIDTYEGFCIGFHIKSMRPIVYQSPKQYTLLFSV